MSAGVVFGGGVMRINLSDVLFYGLLILAVLYFAGHVAAAVLR